MRRFKFEDECARADADCSRSLISERALSRLPTRRRSGGGGGGDSGGGGGRRRRRRRRRRRQIEVDTPSAVAFEVTA